MREELDKGRPEWKPFEGMQSKCTGEVDAKWRSLLNNPVEWCDCREAKRQGLVKTTHPDFKKGELGLWLDSKVMPEWVAAELPQVTCLLFDVSQANGALSTLKGRWRSLFDSPVDWVDYRSAKRSGKVRDVWPDFKRVDGRGDLWISGKGNPRLGSGEELAREACRALVAR